MESVKRSRIRWLGVSVAVLALSTIPLTTQAQTGGPSNRPSPPPSSNSPGPARPAVVTSPVPASPVSSAPPGTVPPGVVPTGLLGPEPWPAFSLVYQLTERNGGAPAEPPHTQTFRLDYTDRRHWQQTELADPTMPQFVGTQSTLDGNKGRGYNALLKRTSERDITDNFMYLPDMWLGAGRTRELEGHAGWTAGQDAQGRATLRTQTDASGHHESEEIVYRLADGIPLLRTAYVDGVLTRQLEVKSLQLRVP